MNKADELKLNERYQSVLREVATRSVNGNFSKNKHMTNLLTTMWPDREWGFRNEQDLPLALSDRGGAWTPLTKDEWEGYEEWNEMAALRHGLRLNNGIIQMGIHFIVWRKKEFADALRQIEFEQRERRLKSEARAQQESANMALGRNVTEMREEIAFERAKMAPEPIVSSEEMLAEIEKRHTEPQIRVTVPAMPKKAAPKRKPGRPAKKAASKAVDKPAETS